MKLIFVFFVLLFVCNVYSEEKVDTLDDDDEAPILPKKLLFTKPTIPDNYFLMYFTSPNDLVDLLIASEATKEGVEEVISKYDGKWAVEVPQSSAIEGDYALVLKSKARHAAISAKLNRPFDFSSDQLVVQYEVKFQNGQECGGAYIKLLSHADDLNLRKFYDKTQYTIMFGPDRCGNENKLHFIFQHKHPKTGQYEEKHAKKPSGDIEKYFTDKRTHLYTLVVNSDNSFEVYVDQSLVNSGNLLKDFEPAVNAPKDIDDPTDIKPADWDDTAKIVDPMASKPLDWDDNAVEYIEDKNAVKPDGWLEHESLTVADEKAERPKDWDDEMDGEWEAPRVDNPVCKSAPGCGPWTAPKIKNPAYKGKWTAPMIDNPNYKGVWKARRIPNPDFFEDAAPYRMTSIGALGLELWSMSDEIVFDNFIIVDNKKAADDFAKETWLVKKDAERMADPNSQSVVDAIRDATSERPWLWLVIVGVVVIPVVLILVYCCRSSSSGSSGSVRSGGRVPRGDHSTSGVAARDAHKKDDDIVEDDEEEEDEEVVVAASTGPCQDSVAAEADQHVTEHQATAKGDLESDDSDNESGDEAADKDKTSSDQEEAGAQATEGSPSQDHKARKRRARKA